MQSGKTIAEPLERTGLFPPMPTQIVGIGERSGRLGEMMEQRQGVFEEQREQPEGGDDARRRCRW